MSETRGDRSTRAVSVRVWIFLTFLPLVGLALLLPTLFEQLMANPLVGNRLASALDKWGAQNLIAMQLAQVALLIGAAAWFGLRLALPWERHAPALYRWLHFQPAAFNFATPLLVGFLVGGSLVLLERIVFQHSGEVLAVPLGLRLAAGILYGGVGEEVLCRLFLVTFLVWILRRFWPADRFADTIWIAAILTAALAFAAGHLPAFFVLSDSSNGISEVLRILTLNMVAGLAFGWLYWKRGLEAAILAHAAAHIPLQLLV